MQVKSNSIELCKENLDEPFSLHTDKTLASVKEMLCCFGSKNVKQVIGCKVSDSSLPIIPATDLNIDDLTILTTEILSKGDPNESLTIINCGVFSPQDLINEIAKKSKIGLQFMASIHRHAIFLEAAVRENRIKLLDCKSIGKIVFPDFDF